MNLPSEQMPGATWAELAVQLDETYRGLAAHTSATVRTIHDFQERMLQAILAWPSVTDWHQLPRRSGVYVLLRTPTMEVRYIGQSVDLRARWAGRRDFRPGDSQPLYYMLSEGCFDLDTMEGLLVMLFAPRHNKRINNTLTPWPLGLAWRAVGGQPVPVEVFEVMP